MPFDHVSKILEHGCCYCSIQQQEGTCPSGHAGTLGNAFDYPSVKGVLNIHLTAEHGLGSLQAVLQTQSPQQVAPHTLCVLKNMPQGSVVCKLPIRHFVFRQLDNCRSVLCWSS
eukprot:TRINITY_DN49578_c0_g1_i1.p1 TRINITY_DN49578_c0_g1~~TRINITY_DN49578_c0_g1_i1.p1  ORF type:complete len:114 (-),score=0.74 TRINITY_DN49578_c0_g1_i1:109-450(-)